MPVLIINQSVDVHSRPPEGQAVEGDEHVHTFNNLIPACEFAVSMDREGHRGISLYTDTGSTLDIDQARRIAEIWESGKVPLEAEQIEY